MLDGGQGGYGTYEIANEDAYGEIGTELPRLNIWDTQAPSQASAHSYAAGEGVNREVTQSDLETLLGGFIPQVLGWEGFDQLLRYVSLRSRGTATPWTRCFMVTSMPTATGVS